MDGHVRASGIDGRATTCSNVLLQLLLYPYLSGPMSPSSDQRRAHGLESVGASTVSSAAPSPSSSTAHLRSLLHPSGETGPASQAVNERTPLVGSSAASTTTDAGTSALTWRAFESADQEHGANGANGAGKGEGSRNGAGVPGRPSVGKRKTTKEYARVIRRRSRYYIPVSPQDLMTMELNLAGH